MDSGALRLARWFLVVLVGILCWTASALGQDESKPKQDQSKSADADVLEIVLSDLLNRHHSPVERDLFPPADAKPGDETRLRFSTEALSGEITVVFPGRGSGALWEDFAKEWSHLNAREQASAEDAANDLKRRTRKKDGFKTFVPKNKRITMYTKEQEAQQRETDAHTAPFGHFTRQVFRAFSPGYSADRRVAVVSLSFGWSGNFHSAQGTYILVKRNDQWSIIVRNLIFFT